MPLTWRDRLDRARRRRLGGIIPWPGFRLDDLEAWGSVVTCPAGEVRARYGLPWSEGVRRLFQIGNTAATPLYASMVLWPFGQRRRIDQVERILDACEDAGLRLKREAR